MAFVVLPAMTGDQGDEAALKPTESEANPEEGEYSVTVTVKLMNQAKTKVMEWFNGKRKVTVDNGSSAGTLSINGDTPGSAGTNVTFDLEFENGVGEFTVTLGEHLGRGQNRKDQRQRGWQQPDREHHGVYGQNGEPLPDQGRRGSAGINDEREGFNRPSPFDSVR